MKLIADLPYPFFLFWGLSVRGFATYDWKTNLF